MWVCECARGCGVEFEGDIAAVWALDVAGTCGCMVLETTVALDHGLGTVEMDDVSTGGDCDGTRLLGVTEDALGVQGESADEAGLRGHFLLGCVWGESRVRGRLGV